MTDKSHVSMEQKLCLICRKKFDTGGILFDTKLRERFFDHTTTGVGQCAECEAMNEKGYVALVGASNPDNGSDTLTPEDAVYTAEYLWLKRDAAEQIINTDISDFPFVYIEPEAIKKIKALVGKAFEDQADEGANGSEYPSEH